MRIKITIFLILFFNVFAWGQTSKSSLPTKTNDTLFVFIDSLQTTDLDYFKLTPKMIKKENVVKSEEQKYIYGNPKGGTVLIYLKNKYKSIPLSKILRTDFYDPKIVQFFIDNSVSLPEKSLQTSIGNLSKIEFKKRDTTVYEIRLTRKKMK